MKSAELHADTESSPLWDRIRKAEHDNNQAAARISRLEAALTQIAWMDEFLSTEAAREMMNIARAALSEKR